MQEREGKRGRGLGALMTDASGSGVWAQRVRARQRRRQRHLGVPHSQPTQPASFDDVPSLLPPPPPASLPCRTTSRPPVKTSCVPPSCATTSGATSWAIWRWRPSCTTRSSTRRRCRREGLGGGSWDAKSGLPSSPCSAFLPPSRKRYRAMSSCLPTFLQPVDDRPHRLKT